MKPKQSVIIYSLGFLVFVLLVWNILVMAGVVSTPYNSSKASAEAEAEPESMVGDGPAPSGLQAFGPAPPTARQNEKEKREIIASVNKDSVQDYGSAYGGPPGARESMKAFYAGKSEKYSGVTQKRGWNGGTRPRERPNGEHMTAIGSKSRSKNSGGVSASLPALKGVGTRPYASLMRQEKVEGLRKNNEKFIYTEKMQAFSGGEKYRVVTGRACSASPINNLTGMVIDTCQAHCAHDNQCAAFTYNFRNGDCRTYNSCKMLHPEDEEIQTFSREK